MPCPKTLISPPFLRDAGTPRRSKANPAPNRHPPVSANGMCQPRRCCLRPTWRGYCIVKRLRYGFGGNTIAPAMIAGGERPCEEWRLPVWV
jgi:hypothetical protein